MSSLQTLFYTFAKVFFSSSHFGSCFWNWLFTHFIFDPSLSFLRHSRVSLNRPCPRLLHFMGPSFQVSPYRKTTERIRSRAEIQEKTQSQPGLFFSVKQAHLMMNIHSVPGLLLTPMEMNWIEPDPLFICHGVCRFRQHLCSLVVRIALFSHESLFWVLPPLLFMAATSKQRD